MSVKKSFQTGLLLGIAVGTQSYAMEHVSEAIQYLRSGANSHVGQIDRLIVERAVLENGYECIKHNIENHEFLRDFFYETMPPQYRKEPNPYSIKYHIAKDHHSDLSRSVFHMISKTTVLEMKFNVENALNDAGLNAIDHCSTWEREKGSKDVYVTSNFFDKAALLKAVDDVRK